MPRTDHTLWLPEGVHPDEARPLDFTDSMQAHVFRNQLKQLDTNRIDMIRTKPACSFAEGDRYLIVYRSEDGVISWFLIQDEHGQFCDPDVRHWDRLMRYDQARSNGSLLEKFRKERALIEGAARAAREDKSERFREELGHALSHLFDPKISVGGRAKDLIDGAISQEQDKLAAARADRTNTLKKMNRKQWR
jgi:hypothetical protein